MSKYIYTYKCKDGSEVTYPGKPTKAMMEADGYIPGTMRKEVKKRGNDGTKK